MIQSASRNALRLFTGAGRTNPTIYSRAISTTTTLRFPAQVQEDEKENSLKEETANSSTGTNPRLPQSHGKGKDVGGGMHDVGYNKSASDKGNKRKESDGEKAQNEEKGKDNEIWRRNP